MSPKPNSRSTLPQARKTSCLIPRTPFCGDRDRSGFYGKRREIRKERKGNEEKFDDSVTKLPIYQIAVIRFSRCIKKILCARLSSFSWPRLLLWPKPRKPIP